VFAQKLDSAALALALVASAVDAVLELVVAAAVLELTHSRHA
jgi:hypothetical protein